MLVRRDVAVIAVFSALAVSSNYAMLAFFQIKIMDALVFIAAYLFGFRIGAGVAGITWLVYGSLNPLGSAGFPLLLVLMIGETVYAASGALLSRVWKKSTHFDTRSFTRKSLVLGAIGLLSAFVYDLWTNAIDGLMIYRSFDGIIIRMMTGIYFALVHEVADFIFFAFAVPVLIISISRATRMGK